jgi:hypothetical protein
MEHLWSQAGATGGNRSQMGAPRKRPKQADQQPAATHGNGFGAHGKEGVNGSSPLEGFAKAPHAGAFSVQKDLQILVRAVRMEPLRMVRVDHLLA